MINELVVATHNQGKVEEFKTLMKDLPIILLNLFLGNK